MKDADEFVARLETAQGPTRYTTLRDQLRKDKEIDDNPIPPG